MDRASRSLLLTLFWLDNRVSAPPFLFNSIKFKTEKTMHKKTTQKNAPQTYCTFIC